MTICSSSGNRQMGFPGRDRPAGWDGSSGVAMAVTRPLAESY